MIKLLKRINEPDTPNVLPTIRSTTITVEQVHYELMLRTSHDLILAKYPDLENEDIQAVWVYKAFQNNKDGVIDLQELISTLKTLPKKVSLLQLYDHIDFIFQIQKGVAETVEEIGTPHEQVMREMREYITGLKAKANLNDN
ncbi:DUF433 domain-containing protein [Spirosoma foliorum]|uniref:DUF433 domain-containing protein n=1 Tax=Spirosoma foliorum TaxID=2710596 RepID=A0A7G5GVT8_9BACT|nr:DUF433 domain-containing protein [Spirosoma foliorum]QMW02980.1 DUF433 domain-containing protein [Spirosoma foliorum]